MKINDKKYLAQELMTHRDIPWIGSNQMKLITAIIKPFKLDDVREAIANLGWKA